MKRSVARTTATSAALQHDAAQAAEALGADANGYASAVDASAGETAAYADALRRLASSRTAPR